MNDNLSETAVLEKSPILSRELDGKYDPGSSAQSCMAAPPQNLVTRPEWKALLMHYQTIRHAHLRELFLNDPARGERFSVEAAGIYFDYSKNRITEKTISLLTGLVHACGIRQKIEAMFNADRINGTENRSALHTALRSGPGNSTRVDGQQVAPMVNSMLDRMACFADQIRTGEWLGYTGRKIRHIVNIGIGGSDLGPRMAYEALRHYSQRNLHFHFISNVDGSDFSEVIRNLDPAETLFVICSKTFMTTETLENANSARQWCLNALKNEQAISRHFVAVSSNAVKTSEFGIATANTYDLWDWIGGRYSMTSAIGLSTMIAIGPVNFRAMLAGFRAMDEHYRSAPAEKNIPMLMGMLSVWNNNFFGSRSFAVLPYDHYLQLLPAYLQQLTMESNGKQITLDGVKVDYQTAQVCWGGAGSNAQHSFFQLLHQGTQLIPCDFIGFCRSLNPLARHHDILMANLFAQTEALAFGTDESVNGGNGICTEPPPHRWFEGNRPSNTILAERLDPATLGALIALYEHSVFTQAAIWNINPFDQWGVELGKALAKQLLPEIRTRGNLTPLHDSSTNALIRRYHRNGIKPEEGIKAGKISFDCH